MCVCVGGGGYGRGLLEGCIMFYYIIDTKKICYMQKSAGDQVNLQPSSLS